MVRTFFTTACVLLLSASASAQSLTLASVFQSHMVVQRDQPIRVFGSAAPNAMVVASFGANSRETAAASDGRFEIALPPQPASANGASLMVKSGTQTVTLDDVLVGEVWLCSGQSNMEWPLAAFADCQQAIAEAEFPAIRLLRMHLTDDPKAKTFDGREQREPGTLGMFDGRWEVCSPETARGFSAIAYSFGRELYGALDCPIGLIQNAVGGSPAEAWISRPTLAKDEATAPMLVNWTECPLIHPWCTGDGKAWLEERSKRAEAARQKGEPAAPEQHHRFEPTALFDGGIVPLTGTALRGVIWYQGESNSHAASLFENLMPRLLADWRRTLRSIDLPFLYVQLAAWGPGETWPELRAAQARLSLTDAHATMVSAIDLGDTNDIHPPGKLVVGKRLARNALRRIYQRDVPAGSPHFTKCEVRRSDARESLVVEVASMAPLTTTDGNAPLAFELAGESGDFAAATARILADGKIELASDKIQEPRRVRYAWAANPKVNLIDPMTEEPLLPFEASAAPSATR